MHIVDFAASIDPGLYLPVILSVGLAGVLLLYRESFGLFDPLWLLVMAMSFGVANLVYIDVLGRQESTGFAAYIALTVVLFAAGAAISRSLLRRGRNAIRQDGAAQTAQMQSSVHRRFANRVLISATMLLMLALLVRAVTVGLPIFAANPETQRVAVNSGGFGLLQRVIEPCVYCVLLLVFYLGRATGKTTQLRAICFSVAMVALLVSGAKGALVMAYNAFFFANLYISLRTSSRKSIVPVKAILIAGVGIIGYAMAILTLRAVGTSEEDVSGFVINTFFARLIAYGDGIYYFFVSGRLYERMTYSPLDFLYREILVPFLAPLRILSYPSGTLGNDIALFMFGEQTRGGPNPTMAVEGYAFFGMAGGLVYCTLLGALFGYLRRVLLTRRPRHEMASLLLFGFVNTLVLRLPSDFLYFTGGIVDVVLTMSVVIVMASILSRLKPDFGQQPTSTGIRSSQEPVLNHSSPLL